MLRSQYYPLFHVHGQIFQLHLEEQLVFQALTPKIEINETIIYMQLYLENHWILNRAINFLLYLEYY